MSLKRSYVKQTVRGTTAYAGIKVAIYIHRTEALWQMNIYRLQTDKTVKNSQTEFGEQGT